MLKKRKLAQASRLGLFLFGAEAETKSLPVRLWRGSDAGLFIFLVLNRIYWILRFVELSFKDWWLIQSSHDFES